MIFSEQAYELYCVSGQNKCEALRAFKRIHPGHPAANYPGVDFFVYNYKKMKKHKTVRNVVSISCTFYLNKSKDQSC